MLVYSLRRLLATIPILVFASIFTFSLVELFGDPLAPLYLIEPPVPETTIVAETERLYRDRPSPERYWLWLTGLGNSNGDIGLLQGKWGPGNSPGLNIGEEIGDRAIVSLRLLAAGVLLAFVGGIFTGVVSAVKQYSKLDHFLTFTAFLALAMPIFWLAALVKSWGVWLNTNVFGAQVLYTQFATSPGYDRMSPFEKVGDVAGHLLLPTLVTALAGYAVIARYQRAQMLEVLNSDYVRLARAKGLRNRVVMRRHALRTALTPTVTLFGVTIYATITGATITEIVFGWQGMGRFLVERIGAIDNFAVMAFVVFAAVLITISFLISDLLYGVLDPRVRYE